jgi:hypothetical protein
MGWRLTGKELVQAFWIESDHYFVINDESGGGATLVFINQVLQRALINADIPFFELDAPPREKGLYRITRRTAGLSKQYYLGHKQLRTESLTKGRRKFQTYSITNVTFAVFCSMAETEQYFSLESRTASSMAFFDTAPPTR